MKVSPAPQPEKKRPRLGRKAEKRKLKRKLKRKRKSGSPARMALPILGKAIPEPYGQGAEGMSKTRVSRIPGIPNAIPSFFEKVQLNPSRLTPLTPAS